MGTVTANVVGVLPVDNGRTTHNIVTGYPYKRRGSELYERIRRRKIKKRFSWRIYRF